MGILAIRDVQRINPNADFPHLACGTLFERDVDRKVPVYLNVERKISSEAEAIGGAYVVLQDIHIRIRKAGVHVDDGAKHQAPKRQMDKAPDQQAVRDVGRLYAVNIGAKHWNLKRDERIRERIEVAARAAPGIRHVDFALLAWAVTRSRLRLAIVRGSRVLQRQKAIRIGRSDRR